MRTITKSVSFLFLKCVISATFFLIPNYKSGNVLESFLKINDSIWTLPYRITCVFVYKADKMFFFRNLRCVYVRLIDDKLYWSKKILFLKVNLNKLKFFFIENAWEIVGVCLWNRRSVFVKFGEESKLFFSIGDKHCVKIKQISNLFIQDYVVL